MVSTFQPDPILRGLRRKCKDDLLNTSFVSTRPDFKGIETKSYKIHINSLNKVSTRPDFKGIETHSCSIFFILSFPVSTRPDFKGIETKLFTFLEKHYFSFNQTRF